MHTWPRVEHVRLTSDMETTGRGMLDSPSHLQLSYRNSRVTRNSFNLIQTLVTFARVDVLTLPVPESVLKLSEKFPASQCILPWVIQDTTPSGATTRKTLVSSLISTH